MESDVQASPLQLAFDALDAAGVEFALRKGQGRDDELTRPIEVDIELAPADRRRADEALRAAGFELFEARGIGPHRFYLAQAGGRWIKVDAKFVLEGRSRGLLGKVTGRLPLSARRAGPVVALVGPDGAGKGSVIERLRLEIPLAVDVFYLGWKAPRRRLFAKTGRAGRRTSAPRECAGILRGYLRASRTLLRAYAAAWRGTIVLCDRHPLEVLAVPPRRSRPAAALEGALARRLTPRPDAIVVLDAPVGILLARKDEHSAATLERWRAGYRRVFGDDPRAVIVSTVDPLGTSVARVSQVVWEALSERRRWAT